MSNAYKDWLYDMYQDTVLELSNCARILYCKPMKDGGKVMYEDYNGDWHIVKILDDEWKVEYLTQ